MGNIITKPWGTYEVIDSGSNFSVKKIIVKPDGVLSLQSHSFRSEHWTVVSGKGRVILGNKAIDLYIYQSIDIPVNFKHRLANYGDNDLVIIEIWFGEKLSEDDIIRYEDIYNRV